MRTLTRIAVLMVCFIGGNAFAAGGACPSGVPVTGSNCYFIAANGSDSNSGTTESSPWAHAPGMPNCTANCAAVNPGAGEGFIFRGGDTWHFGNSGATPYTGGTWNWTWSGSGTNCDTSDSASASRGSCVYIGVDKSWYSGASWSRPIMTGDNPTSTSPVSSCTYGNVGSANDFLKVTNNAYAWFDNLEWTGMCQQTASGPSTGYLYDWNLYILDIGGGAQLVQNVYSNMYAHGWTHLAFSCSDSTGEPVGQCFSESFISGTIAGITTLGPGNICDGWDSDPTAVGCILYAPGYLVYDNVFANFAQIVVNDYHSWHDNYFYNYYPTGDGIAHGNTFESNVDAPGTDSSGHHQPSVPFNAFYNNVLGHNAAGTTGDVKLWFCPNTTAAEYWFNNIVYDQGAGNNWDVATSGFNCTTSGHEYMFNNTIDLPSSSTINCVAGQVATGNHIITESGTGFAGGSCATSKNVVMSHSTAVSQGYMAASTGTSGSNSNTTCANDITPCAPTSGSNSTVGKGANLQSYCTALLGSTDPMIVNAGGACKYATTDSCRYDSSTRSVSCPRTTAVVRPTDPTVWDAGAYQFGSSQVSGPAAPTNLTDVVH